MKQLIYLHTINNKSYIGQTIRTLEIRLKEHIRDAKNGKGGYFHKAIRKYGADNITSEILEDNIKIQSNLSTKETLADSKEILYIEKYDTYNNGYNMTKGGKVGVCQINSKETKERKRMAGKRRAKTDEFKKNMIDNPNRGMNNKNHSDESKLKMSKTRKGSIPWNKGLSLSTIAEDVKEKMRGKRSLFTCPHCGKEGGISSMKQWHGEFGEKCKN